MKDLGETLSLTNGVADDASVRLKAVTNGVASLSRSSSSSSGDLHLHLAEDSDEDGDNDRNNSESVHDPKTSKLSATGASLINMYKDSSKKYLEIVKSHCKEIDRSIVESTACSKPNLVKMDEQCKRVDSNNSDAKHADGHEKDVETCLQVTADVKETTGNNTLNDASKPVAKEPTKTPTNKCNSSSFEAASRNKEGSLTNGAVKAVTESNSLEANAISMDTIAEPLKIHIAEKKSKHLDAKMSLEQNLEVETTSLVKNNTLHSSIDSNNVVGQGELEMIPSKPSGQDCKDKEEVQRTALDKEPGEDCKDKEEVQRTVLDKEPGEDSKDKEEVQRTVLDKEPGQDCKDKEEVQRTALDKEPGQDCKDKEEVQRTALDKEPGEDSNDMGEMQRTALDKEPGQDRKDKEEVQRTALDKEPGQDCKDKEEVQRTAVDKEPRQDCKDKEEVQRTALDKEPGQDCKDKEEVQRTAVDKEPGEDCKDEEEVQRTALDIEPGQDCKNRDEVQITTLDEEPGEDCKDKEEVQRTALDKEPGEDCKDKEEVQRTALDKEPEGVSKDKEELQITALVKEPEEDCKGNDEVQKATLDKEPEEDCKGSDDVQRATFDKEREEDCKDKKQMQRTAFNNEPEDFKDKEELQRSSLDKEIGYCKDKKVFDKEFEEDCKDNEEVQNTGMDKEIEENCKDMEEVHKGALGKEIQEVQRLALDKETVKAKEQSKESCDDFLPKEEGEDGESYAPLAKSEHFVTFTSAHSGESKDVELTSILDIAVVDNELDSKPTKLLENVEENDLKPEPDMCQEIESEAPAMANVVSSNGSVETEQPTHKVEDIAVKSDDETVLTCPLEDYSVVKLNDSNSAKEDDAVAAHIPEVDESESSDVDSEGVIGNADIKHLNGSANDENTAGTTNSEDPLKITSKSTFIDLCDSADEPDNSTPGKANVFSDDSQLKLTIDLGKDNSKAGIAPKSEIKEDVGKVESTTKISIEQKVESSDMETDETLVKFKVGSCVQVEPPSPPTDGNKGDSTFDMLLKDEINKTSESVTCKIQVGKAQQPQADAPPMTKENDVSTADIQGSSVSPDRDDSSGFSGHGQKRTSSIDNLIETKKAKLTNGHDMEVITNSRKDVASIDLTNEKTCTKRSLEFSDGLESKKARVLSVDESSSNSCASSMSNEHVSKQPEEGIAMEESSTVPVIPRKSLSNIDKAIERVAFAGLDRKERIMMPFIKDLKNRRLQDITIDDLEELVTQRMGEVLSETGENGVLREKVQKLEKMTEFWKLKATSLQKQLSDMTMVFKKLATETKQNSNQMQIPIKITRSVGLQVIMPSLQSVSKSNATHVRNGLSPGTKRKSGGIMTNRNTTPTLHYPSSTVMSPNRTPVVQKMITPATVKLPQAVPAPKPSIVTPPSSPAVRFRAPTTTVASSATGTVMTVAGNLRTAASIAANRPVVKSVTPRSAQPLGGDTLIDLTDEDDRTRRVSTNPLGQQLRVAQLNGSPPTLGSTIRFGPPQQLTGIATGVNGQRLAYMLPASAANAAPGRLQLFTQQTGGNLRPSGMLTVRPSTQTQTLLLKNGAVVSSAASPSSMIRAGATGTFQQVVARPSQMRTIQPASRPVVSLPPPLHTQHPAPLPPPPPEFPSNPSWKKPPPRPDLKISKVDNREQHGIILSWNMDHGTEHEEIASYQLYAYQENSSPPSTSQWKKVGDVKAMPLPMACTLTQFLEGNKYHFAVRAIDIHSRSGLFSIPGHIILPRRGS